MMNKDLNDNYRYTLLGKVTLVESDEGKFILKEKTHDSNIKGLYSYLKSRDFYTFPEVLDDTRKELNVFEYVDDLLMPKEQRAEDLVNNISLLHSKTLYFKEVREDKFKEIYENIESNIKHLDYYFETLYNRFFKEVYMAPSHYLFMQNFYKIKSALLFCTDELDKWYELVKEERKMRVSIVHNDLSIDHFLKGEKEAIISWEKHSVDTPAIDIVKFYQNDNLKYDFSVIFDKYNERMPMNLSEKKLFFILISLPKKINFDQCEFDNTINMRKALDYMFKTENLVKPYYSENEIKE